MIYGARSVDIMKTTVVSLFLLAGLSATAQDTVPVHEPVHTVSAPDNADDGTTAGIEEMIKSLDKEAKISRCVEKYIKKESKSYSKIVQNNLYDLMHDFDRIASRLLGTKIPADNVPFSEKLAALAKVQCDAYYMLGNLK